MMIKYGGPTIEVSFLTLPTFDQFRQDNHCWIKAGGVDWRIDAMDGYGALHVSSQEGFNIIDLSHADLERYTIDANRLIMEAYSEEAI